MRYKCGICSYETNYISHYKKHMRSIKHSYKCDICNKVYKTRSGLWKHTHKHNTTITHLQSTIESQNKLINQIIPKIGNTTITNKISINLFLERNCKDAVDFSEFLKKMHITVDDLDTTKELGYVDGISNIFLKRLDVMNITTRPIHCCDKKRFLFYIKNDNKWDRGEVENAISHVAHRQITQIKEWEKQHPLWYDNGSKEYLQLINAVMGGSTDKEQKKNTRCIIKILSDKLYLDNDTIING
jgi:hypothetical protein